MDSMLAPDATTLGRGARAMCTIDLDALVQNARTLQDGLQGSARLWPVVKADAYGHGVLHAARVLGDAGLDRLCVATLSEARELRAAKYDGPLLVLGPLDERGIVTAHDMGVEVTALSVGMVESIASLGRSIDGLVVHLKIDTGMGRWGVPRGRAASCATTLLRTKGVRLLGCMTHFATADEQGDFFDLQLQRFQECVAELEHLNPDMLFHCANSAATLRTTDTHFDAVRCGIALYGLSPTQGNPSTYGLRPVMSKLLSRIADVRRLESGESTGYCRTFVAKEPCHVGLVPVGYADGIRRSLANRGEVLLAGQRCPMVGNVSMDHFSVLVPDTAVPGDEVVLLGESGGERISIEDHARWADTINYEISCGIASEPRMQRSLLEPRR